MTERSRWCPSCGDEYHPRIERCIDCRVELLEERPTALTPVEPSHPGAEVEARFPIDDLDGEQRVTLVDHLESGPVPFLLSDDVIEAVAGYEVEVGAAVRRVRNGEDPAEWRRHDVVLAEGSPLPLDRRIVAGVIDVLVLPWAVGAALLEFGPLGIEPLIVLAAALVNQVVGFGERGRSLGKLAVLARVRSIHGGPMGWGRALVRWAVLALPALTWWVVAFGLDVDLDPSAGSIYGAVWIGVMAALAITVAVDRQRRGLHDLALDTVVVSDASLDPPPPTFP